MKPIDIAKKYFGEYRTHGLEIVPTLCPFCNGGSHEDKNTFSLNMESGAYNCLRGSCGVKGSFTELLKHYGEKGSSNYELRKPKPVSFVPPKVNTDELGEKAKAYLQSRGISQKTWEMLGVVEKNGVIAFPYYENGKLVLMKYRKPEKYLGNGQKAWREPGGKAVFWGMDLVDVDAGKLLIVEGECFPGTAQVLTEEGWVAFSDYSGQRVMQVHDDLTANFTKPLNVIRKPYDGKLLRVDRGGNYCSETTPGHKLVYVNDKGRVVKREVKDMPATVHGHIPTTVTLDGKGIPLSDDQLSLCLAVSADGVIDHRNNNGHNGVYPRERRFIRSAFKKKRKIERLCGLLDRLGLEYSCNPIKSGFTSICFPLPDWCCERLLPQEWVTSATLRQRKHILNEMVYWDGNNVPNRNQTEYSTKHLHNAIIIQTLAHTSGYMSTIMKRENKFGAWYKVSVLYGKSHVSWQNVTTEEVDYSGVVYCVTVETGMLLVRQENKITVTGNCDQLALYEAGVRNVVSVPSGAEDLSCVENCWDWLEQFNKICIWPDNDTPGQEMCRKLINKLGAHRCFVVHSDHKDANEALYKEGAKAVAEYVRTAKEVPIAGLQRLADVESFDLNKVKRVHSSISGVDQALGGYMMGMLTVWTGVNASGKSTFVGQELIEAISQGFRVCAYSGELPMPIFRYWIELQIAGPEKLEAEYDTYRKVDVMRVRREWREPIRNWYRNEFFIYDSLLGVNADNLLEVFEYAVKRYGCQVFLVDNLMLMVFADQDKVLYQRQSDFTKQLKAFAQKYNVHVHLVAHPRKVDGRVQKMDVMGSGNITNLADNVLGVYRPATEEGREEIGADASIDVFKARFTGRQDLEIPVRFHIDCKRFHSGRRLEVNYLNIEEAL